MHTLVPIWDGRMLFNSIDVDGNCGRHFENFSIEKVEKRCPIYPGDLTAGDIVGLFWLRLHMVILLSPRTTLA